MKGCANEVALKIYIWATLKIIKIQSKGCSGRRKMATLQKIDSLVPSSCPLLRIRPGKIEIYCSQNFTVRYNIKFKSNDGRDETVNFEHKFRFSPPLFSTFTFAPIRTQGRPCRREMETRYISSGKSTSSNFAFFHQPHFRLPVWTTKFGKCNPPPPLTPIIVINISPVLWTKYLIISKVKRKRFGISRPLLVKPGQLLRFWIPQTPLRGLYLRSMMLISK